MAAPEGLDEIIHTFGSLDDPNFVQNNIVTMVLPYPLLFNNEYVYKTQAHRLVVPSFRQVFNAILEAGLSDEAREYGGIYCPRGIRGHISHPSTHSWGIAIDLNPTKFPLGSTERQNIVIQNIFKAAGFTYGGDFSSRKDPMHWQFASKY